MTPRTRSAPITDAAPPPAPSYAMVAVADLIPYARNARTHTPAQVQQIAASIREFGFLAPVITDGANGILAGHGRILAAHLLKLTEVPVIQAAHLSEAQRRAYVLADNRLALSAGWDDDLLRVEITDLQGLDFNISLLGFEDDELTALFDGPADDEPPAPSNYSRTVVAPIYEITGECPPVAALVDRTKTETLLARIDAEPSLPPDVAAFLRYAAERHSVFNFRHAAEFYAHASAEVQELMEQSALIVIDFDRAIEDGYVKLTQQFAQQFADEQDTAFTDRVNDEER